MAYPRDEQETTCVYDPVTDKWIVYSSLKRHITRLLKVGGEPVTKEVEDGRIVAGTWEIGPKQVRFAKLFGAAAEEETDDAVCGD
ncbi:hypothetical protein [Paenibacillus sp. 481]|uniref:hypothetical protein n=1 Tax=Paenibacillus sp. 481 TaxID=2835869 RepID=UPI001E51212C|nr:hypothetical protein [Paenibacillus sp. 481]UHA74424.1 hypothetical protein KIK04_04770 [Paenibacillus sp. 481]